MTAITTNISNRYGARERASAHRPSAFGPATAALLASTLIQGCSDIDTTTTNDPSDAGFRFGGMSYDADDGFAGRDLTPANNVPQTGSAIYEGVLRHAIYHWEEHDGYETSSAQISTDFATGQGRFKATREGEDSSFFSIDFDIDGRSIYGHERLDPPDSDYDRRRVISGDFYGRNGTYLTGQIEEYDYEGGHGGSAHLKGTFITQMK